MNSSEVTQFDESYPISEKNCQLPDDASEIKEYCRSMGSDRWGTALPAGGSRGSAQLQRAELLHLPPREMLGAEGVPLLRPPSRAPRRGSRTFPGQNAGGPVRASAHMCHGPSAPGPDRSRPAPGPADR